MRHFPAHRYSARIEGLSHSHAPRSLSLTTVALLSATFFAAGFAAAVWTIGMILTAS